MFAALLATLLFAVSIVFANRSVQASGARRANLGRLGVAAVALGLFAHIFGTGFSSASTPWLILSGVIGMGLGDLGVFAALPLIGSRLTVLVTQCLAAPIAALAEWMWLGTRLSGAQMLWSTVTLAGVALALMPSRSNPPRVPLRPAGFIFSLIGAAGQGLGAIVSRKGYFVAFAAGETSINGITAAYHRILGGLVLVAGYFLVRHLLGRPVAGAIRPERHGWKWFVANGLAGPVLGVSCYQWALISSPAGVVLPIVATTPLVAIPFTFWLEGDRPSKRSLVGGVIAVAGCIALTTS